MFKNKHIDGKCNRCGEQIAKLRKQLPDKTSQRILADRMQEKGIDMDKNAIQRIEHGDRFVTDIELAAFADFFGVSSDVLLGKNVAKFRNLLAGSPSQEKLAAKMQLEGLNINKNAIQRIECGKRMVKDIELDVFAKIFHVSVDELMYGPKEDR